MLRLARAVLMFRGMADRRKDGSGDPLGVFVYVLWAAILLVLFRYT